MSEPGSDFNPIGSIATYASTCVAPAALSGVVKDAVDATIQIVIPGVGNPVLISTIARLVPPPS